MTFFFICMCIQLMGMLVTAQVWRAEDSLCAVTPSTKWVSGIKLGLSDLAADIFPCEAALPAL